MSHWNSSSLLADLLLKAINDSWNGCPRDFLFYGGSPSAADLQPLPLSSLIWSRHRLVNHIPFLVNLKLRMKNHHAGNCTDGSTLGGERGLWTPTPKQTPWSSHRIIPSLVPAWSSLSWIVWAAPESFKFSSPFLPLFLYLAGIDFYFLIYNTYMNPCIGFLQITLSDIEEKISLDYK